jgi:hypothetical protein
MAWTSRRVMLTSLGGLALTLVVAPAWAQKNYDEGATDTEIKIGNTNPCVGRIDKDQAAFARWHEPDDARVSSPDL